MISIYYVVNVLVIIIAATVNCVFVLHSSLQQLVHNIQFW